MPLTITDFIGHIKKYNLARPNRYDIFITIPEQLIHYLSDNAGNAAGILGEHDVMPKEISQSPVGTERMLALSCISAEVPTVTALTSDISYGNYPRKIPYDMSVGEFRTTFLVTGQINEKRLFDAWRSIIFNQENHRVGYYDDFITSISVSCLNQADQIVYHYELIESYPISVSSIQLDRTSQNTQMTIEVTWAFHKVLYDPNKYIAKDMQNLSEDEQLAILTNKEATARDLNLPDVPNVHYAKVEVNDIMKAAKRIRDQVQRGEIKPEDGLRLVRQLTRDFNSLTGIDTQTFNSVSKVLGDLSVGMPIQIPGIGRIPTKLPF